MAAVSRFFSLGASSTRSASSPISPLHVAAYVEALEQDFEKPTVKQHLAALRRLFDWLVTPGWLPPTGRRPSYA
jgi:site-specific recombinase XerD